MIKKLTTIFVFITASCCAQKNIQCGLLQLKLSSPSTCSYIDKGYLVENYFEVQNDTFYTYDVWYTVTDNKVKEVDQVVLEAGALKDIVISTLEIDRNSTTDSTCEFAIFIYDESEGNGSGFCHRLYTKDSIKIRRAEGMLIIFCNNYSLFDTIKTMIIEGKKQK